jgi:asparagine synthase (glutamine-hydrolysing)
MCGIAGILNLSSTNNISEDVILRMISILNHRGPEENGAYFDKHIHMGHARLSIIGLTKGTQPISNQDGTLWTVYNGEVFNYIELKAQLEKKGHQFATDTDTEVILHLYEEMGPACLSELNGQFAIAIWDSKKKELFLARDRVGICPLYYTLQNGRFIFASEIKGLFMDSQVSREIDLTSLQQVFTCWTTIGPRTIFKNINEIAPGHFMVIKKDSAIFEQKPFWSLPYYPREMQYKGTEEEAAEKLKELLEDAVRLRLRADVPVGAYLSGGLDSSIITSIISKKSNNRLKTFSLGFEEKAFDETDYQSAMIEFLNTDHSQTNIINQQISEFFSDIIWSCEKPLLRTSPVPLYMLSRLVRDNGFKVVLTGEGADEVFGGYNIFKEAKIRSFWARQPNSRFRPLLLEQLYPYIFQNPRQSRAFLQKFFSASAEDLYNPLMSHQKRWKNTKRCTTFFSKDVLNELTACNPIDDILERLPEGFSGRDQFSRAQWLEMDIFMSNYLLSSQGDRVAMANSVELRVPFLDHRLIDFAAKLPAHWKIYGLDEKYILKKAFQHQVPEKIIKRAKQPYRAPISQAFFNDGDTIFNNLIKEDQLKKAGIFNPKKVRYLFKKSIAQKNGSVSESENMAIVGILSTQLIHEQFIKGLANLSILPAKPDKVIRRN